MEHVDHRFHSTSDQGVMLDAGAGEQMQSDIAVLLAFGYTQSASVLRKRTQLGAAGQD